VAVDELAASFHHDVDLVARVRLLRIASSRRVDLDIQRPVLEKSRPPLPVGARKLRETLSHRHARLHDHLPYRHAARITPISVNRAIWWAAQSPHAASGASE